MKSKCPPFAKDPPLPLEPSPQNCFSLQKKAAVKNVSSVSVAFLRFFQIRHRSQGLEPGSFGLAFFLHLLKAQKVHTTHLKRNLKHRTKWYRITLGTIYIYIIVSCVLDYSSSGYFKHFAMRTHNPSFSICLLLLKPANGSQVSPHPSPFFCERLNLGSLVLSYFVSSFSTLVSAVCFLSPFSPQIQTSNISCSARSSFSFCSWSRFSKSCTLQNLTTSHALMSNTKHCCTASHASHLLNFWTGSACRVREIFEKTGNGPKQGNTFEKTAKMD